MYIVYVYGILIPYICIFFQWFQFTKKRMWGILNSHSVCVIVEKNRMWMERLALSVRLKVPEEQSVPFDCEMFSFYYFSKMNLTGLRLVLKCNPIIVSAKPSLGQFQYN